MICLKTNVKQRRHTDAQKVDIINRMTQSANLVYEMMEKFINLKLKT